MKRTLLALLLLPGCAVDLVRNSDDAYDRTECVYQCGRSSCLTEDDRDRCATQCYDHTEAKARSWQGCSQSSRNCEMESACLVSFDIGDHDRAHCESICEDLNDGESPDLNAATRTICDNRCYEAPSSQVANFLECVGVDIPDGTATHQGCFDQSIGGF